MFNVGNNLKRSWQILWNYRVLWIFALLLGLTGSSGTGFNYSFGNTYDPASGTGYPTLPSGPWDPLVNQAETWLNHDFVPFMSDEANAAKFVIWVMIAIVLITIVVGGLMSLVRYPAHTAAIRMVNEHEDTGRRMGFKEGWKLGWTRRAFRSWLIDLLFMLPYILIFVGIASIMIGGVTSAAGRGSEAFAMVMFPFIILGCCLFLPVMLFSLLSWLVREFVIRAAVIEGLGVWASFRRGWLLFRRNLGKALLMWLVVFGLGMGLGIGLMLAAIVLIPAYVVLAIPGAIVAAVPGAITYGIASLFASPVLTWIITAVVALPIFLMIVFMPLSLIGGLSMLFFSNNWTLTYRQFAGMEQPPVPPQPEPVTLAEPGDPVQ